MDATGNVNALGSQLVQGQKLLMSAFNEGLGDANDERAKDLRVQLLGVLRAVSQAHRGTLVLCLEACVAALVCCAGAAPERDAFEVRTTESALHSTLLHATALA